MVILAALAAAVLPAGCDRSTPPLVLGTTTSVANSGLLDRILPSYRDRQVRTVQVGSGRALDMLANGTADAVISHAPVREAQALRSRPGWFYRKILFNDFIIVGPPSDPAGIRGVRNAAAAMKQILAARQRFLSRGDESGTHERERELWVEAGVETADRVTIAGAGMGQTLRIASNTGTYTLTDRGTFETFASSLRLEVLVSGDPRLINTYAVLADRANEHGFRFALWLTDGDGRRALASAITSGEIRGFTLWPSDRDGSRPDARPF